MNEDEAKMVLNLANGEEFEANRHNTSLFNFIGDLATRNHVFVVMGDDDGIPTGAYIFQHNEVYPRIVEHMIEHNYPLHLNMTEVAECDEDAFQKSLDQIAEGSFDLPEDWFDN